MPKDALSPPESAGAKTKAAKKGRKPKGARKASTASTGTRLAAVKNDMVKLGLFTGSVAVPSALASAASGYFGDRIKLGGKLDARLVAVAAGLAYKQFGKPSAKVSEMVTAASVGVLSSWLNERSFAFGAARSVPAEPVQATIPGTTTQGIVIGNVHDSVGDAEKRLAKKLARIRRKADKKDVDWHDVADKGRSIADDKGWGGWNQPAAGPVGRPAAALPRYAAPPPAAPSKGGAWFRGQGWRARHPRAAAALRASR